MSNTIGITSEAQWDQRWEGIFDHYQQDIRHAHYLRALIQPDEQRFLEIAAGSFRDMAALNKWGLTCFGVDYSGTAVELAQKTYPDLKPLISRMDCFSMEFDDNFFDVSYHNGFWVLFKEDDDIKRLIAEQVRVTKKRIIATVHNAHNQSFFDYFQKLALEDDLYKIRFFEMDEIKKLMGTFCKHVQIIPVGKGKKHYEDEIIYKGDALPESILKEFTQANLNHLCNSERLLCIGEL